MRAWWLVVAALLVLVVGTARAEAAAPPGEPGLHVGEWFVLDAHERLRVTGMSEFAIDRNGTPRDQEYFGEHRLRIAPRFAIANQVFIFAELDLFSGLVFGDTTAVGGDFLLRPRAGDGRFSWADPRQLWVSWQSPWGFALVAGQMASRWGLGVLANDGAERDPLFSPTGAPQMPLAGDLFDDPTHGDLVDRVGLALAPATWFTDATWAESLRLFLAFDVVFRDEQADIFNGDLALQGVGALAYDAERFSVGAYVVHRRQDDDEGSFLNVTVADLFGMVRLPLANGALRLDLAAEAVMTIGRTDRAHNFERARTGTDVLGFGGLFRAALDWPGGGLLGVFDVGYASGDNDRGDDVNRAFSFDPDHKAGLILFGQVLALMSARASDLIQDPELRAEAPEGIPWIPSNGSITNAFYLNPKVRYRPLDWLAVTVGVLWAYAAADLADPYASAFEGGYPANALGGTGGRDLGVELDLGLSFLLRPADAVTIRLGAEGAAFFPGKAFDAPDGGLDDVYLVRGLFDVTL